MQPEDGREVGGVLAAPDAAPARAPEASPVAGASPTAASPAPLDERPGRVCRNCGAVVTTHFCGHCGQSADDHLLTVRGILSDIVEDQLSMDGSTVRTLSLLMRPGLLTLEYLRGRIVRYLAPVRLFLISTTFFVLAATFAVHQLQPRFVQEARQRIAQQQAQAAREAGPGRAPRPFQLVSIPVDSLWLPAPLRGLVRPVLRKQARINALPIDRALPLVTGASLRATSYILPLLVPAAAGLLALVYWRRRRLFVEHVVFILHTHSFAFLIMGLGTLAQILWRPLALTADVIFLGYLFIALVRVYGDGWWRTIPRFVLFLGLYVGLMALAGPFLRIALVALA